MKSIGYWLYTGEEAIIHLDERNTYIGHGEARGLATETSKSQGKASWEVKEETGMDYNLVLRIRDLASHELKMRENSIAYWGSLLADRGLYPGRQWFDFRPHCTDLGRIVLMVVLGR